MYSKRNLLSIAAAVVMLSSDVSALINKNGSVRSISRTEKERVREIKSRIKVENALNPQTKWFDATIDHFDNHGAGSPTYPMRYLVEDTYWDKENGPIIFYAGNEGDVWTFFDNSGFMTTTLAETFGALVVFGEHRYFGESMPFGDQSFERENLPYLTVEQAMNDYVDLIKFLKTDLSLEDRAVIVGGGSYGGMLAAWLRMKYPQWF
jgi:pimeloyl-ACP methyl ester carboxylesterase